MLYNEKDRDRRITCSLLTKPRPRDIFLSAFQAFDFCLSAFVGMQNSPLVSNMHIKATCRRNARPRTVHTAREILFTAIRDLGIIFVSRFGIRHTRWKGEARGADRRIRDLSRRWSKGKRTDAISTAFCYCSFLKKTVDMSSAGFSHFYDFDT